jgi:phosphatidylglycerol:prolipoprotein diacylglycerol transferase
LPWGIYIEPQNRFPGLESYSFFHPLFLYESLWNLLNFVLILFLSIQFTRGLLPGEVFLFYLSFYALGRFFLEGWRISSWEIGGVPVAQVLSLLLIFASITITVIRRARRGQLKLGV